MNAHSKYHRQIILPEVTQNGQDQLARAKVLCIGAGGLGCPALLYLTAAGIGHIGIVDHDTVEESNLHRQVLFNPSHIGQNKATTAAQILTNHNPDTTVTAYPEKLTGHNAEDLFKHYDLIIDGTDNFDSKFLINDAAYITGKPVIYASILGFEGEVSVFNHQNGPCYRCLFPSKPPQNALTCAEAGVIGALAGMVGSTQAMEAIKLILNTSTLPPLNNAVWRFNLKTNTSQKIQLPKDPECPTCSRNKQEITMPTAQKNIVEFEITIDQARQRLENKDNKITLLDVREQDEWEAGHIDGADHLPLSALLEGHRPDLEKDADIVLYCLRGMRSMQALSILKSQGYKNLQSVKGGYSAWMDRAA